MTDNPDAPTDEDLSALIKPIWLATKPDREAQAIRSSLSGELDDPRWQQWVADFIPDYVWSLVDIAAQRGINTTSASPPSASVMERAKDVRVELLRLGMENNGCQLPAGTLDVISRAIEQAERAAHNAAIAAAAQVAQKARSEAELSRHATHDPEGKTCWLWAFDTANAIEREIRALARNEDAPG